MSAQLEYIEQQIGKDISFFKQRRDFNRQAAFLFTIVPATLSAFATVAIGTAEKLQLQWLPILAMVATAIASIFGAWQALFANRSFGKRTTRPLQPSMI